MIIEFGPGLIYTHPQTAFDALVAELGSDVFTESHTLLGKGGIYTVPGGGATAVLEIDTITPSNPLTEDELFPLIIKGDEGEEVIFQGSGGIAVTDSDKTINCVHVSNIEIEVTSNNGSAIRLSTQFGPDWRHSEGWRFDNCYFHVDPSLTDTFAIKGAPFRVFADNIKIEGFKHFIGYPIEIANANFITGFINGSVIDVQESVVIYDNDTGITTDITLPAFVFLGCTVKGKVGIELSGQSIQVMLFATFNCILDFGVADGMIFKLLESGGGFIFLYGDGCVANVDEYLGQTKGTNYDPDFTYFQDFLCSHRNSIVVDDIELETNLQPGPTSPALNAGLTVPFSAYNGVSLLHTCDAGAYQFVYPGYCTAQDVIDGTGVSYNQLNLESDVALRGLISDWIRGVSGIIDGYCNTSWPLNTHPEGIRRVCTSMMSIVVAVAVERRKHGFIRINDFSIKLIEDDLLTDATKEMLDLFKPGVDVPASGDAVPMFGIGGMTSGDIDNIRERNEWD
ncbi:MAG: hypothetical protein GY841_20095 [FCB group bacterium]|nr:hypothetical protein [FCB group bacterium]